MHGRRKEALRGKLVTMGPKIKTKLLKVSMFYSIILFYNIVRVINCLIASLLLKSDISAFSQTCPKIQGGASAHFPSPEAHAHAYIHLYVYIQTYVIPKIGLRIHNYTGIGLRDMRLQNCFLSLLC